MKRLITFVMMLCMLIVCCNSREVHGAESANGICGDNMTWEFDKESNLLTISGSGEMYHFEYNSENVPEWSEYASEIHSVIVEDGITSIGNHAFGYEYINLEEVIIPETVTTIGNCAFSACSKLKEIPLHDGITTLGKAAFSYCESVKKLTIPSSVKQMADSVFMECYGLETVIFEDGLEGIPEYTFENCTNLSTVEFSDTIQTIHGWAFKNCNLSNIVITSYVEQVDSLAFFGNKIQQMQVDPLNTVYDSRNDCNAVIETDTNTLVIGCVNTVIPDDIAVIGKNAFRLCEELTEIHLPKSIKVIEEAAFHHCRNLKKINMPSSVREIGNNAFFLCISLEGFTIPSSVETIGEDAFLEVPLIHNLSSAEGSPWGAMEVHEYSAGNCTICGTEEPEEDEKKIPFTDVSETAWYYDSVVFVYDNGLMNGISTTKFEPETTLTRGMFATILYRAHGKPDVEYEAIFIDVPEGQWFTDGIIWAYKNGIVNGYGNDVFGTDDNITREQLSVMMYRYAEYMGYDTSEKAGFTTFEDAGRVSSWAEEAMQWAVRNGIINGKSDTLLDPAGQATRAECAAIIMRFLEKYK